MLAASLLALLGAALPSALAAGSECSGSGGLTGNAAAGDPYWLETIEKQGTAPFAVEGYKTFRNVKDYGAVGDGTTDDTAAIQSAISEGERCGEGCPQTSITPAVVYFPAGKYLVSKPIIQFYYTSFVGDAKDWPTLVAAPGLQNDGTGYNSVIEADPYIPGGNGANYWTNQNNFYRAVRNMKVDLTQMAPDSGAMGVHWQVSQATHLQNVEVTMSEADGNNHVGVYMENGSGGFMSDVTTTGGMIGFQLGNQQWTFRNLVSRNAVNGVLITWNWGMYFHNLTVEGAQLAINATTGGDKETQTMGALYVLDSQISDSDTFISTTTNQAEELAGSLVIDNVALNNVPNAVSSAGTTVLEGGSTTIELWAQGSIYTADGTRSYQQGPLEASAKPAGLLNGDGKVFGKSRPQYESFSADQFASVKTEGAKGDGVTDDTAAIQAAIDKYAGCKIIYVDMGEYLITDTIKIPVDTVMTGEYLSVILASGEAFGDAANPKVAFQVGQEGDSGTMEISDIMFSSTAGAKGAIIMEWNVAGDAGAVGIWDAHIRLGGAQATGMLVGNCANTTSPAQGGECDAAFLALHVTPSASAYFENMWVWTADHDIENVDELQINVFTGRGILHEATSPSWYYGTASEHHLLYQYNFLNAANVYMAVPQTESPYFQPTPPPTDYTPTFKGDPTYPEGLGTSWSTVFQGSSDILITSAGFYSFFEAYDQACLDTFNCQSQLVQVDDATTGLNIFNLQTVGSEFQVKDLISQQDNRNGFASTVTFWSTGGSGAASKSSGAASDKMRMRRSSPQSTRATRAARDLPQRPAMW